MKKNTHQSQSLESVSSFSWEENRVILWLTDNGKYLLWAACGAILLSSLFFYFQGSQSGKAVLEYALAERAFNKLSEGTEEVQESLSELQALLLKYPELQSRYDGALAQLLISNGKAEEAQFFANRALNRTKADLSPIYKAYTETTLLIANNQFETALENARDLQNRLMAEHISPTLQAINLLRIAMLQQKLGLIEQEKVTWKEWQIMAQTNPATMPLQGIFNEGKINLPDYIQTRNN